MGSFWVATGPGAVIEASSRGILCYLSGRRSREKRAAVVAVVRARPPVVTNDSHKPTAPSQGFFYSFFSLRFYGAITRGRRNLIVVIARRYCNAGVSHARRHIVIIIVIVTTTRVCWGPGAQHTADARRPG